MTFNFNVNNNSIKLFIKTKHLLRLRYFHNMDLLSFIMMKYITVTGKLNINNGENLSMLLLKIRRKFCQNVSNSVKHLANTNSI